MTTEQLEAEIMYQASIAPFIEMAKKALISREDLRVVSTILEDEYRPIFVQIIVSK